MRRDESACQMSSVVLHRYVTGVRRRENVCGVCASDHLVLMCDGMLPVWLWSWSEKTRLQRNRCTLEMVQNIFLG